MAAMSALSFSREFTTGLDELLFEVCEDLQLTPAKHGHAVEKYETLGELLEKEGSPFHRLRPKIYPQGSMALGTTVKPLKGGPHDLDFVLELFLTHYQVDPMRLLQTLYAFLRDHGVYGPMTSLKNRCVRIEYANDFYMDILPACSNGAGRGTCIKVPDCALGGWCDSDPKGYIDWFDDQTRTALTAGVLAKAEPVPPQESVGEKRSLQLIVQLIKRWRDVYYAEFDGTLVPISIVLTTLAGETYRGERSVSRALNEALNGILKRIDEAHSRGKRLTVWNPSPNVVEDLSERWSGNAAA